MTAALATDEVRFQSYKSQQIPRKGYAPVQGLHQMKYKRRPSFQRNNPYPKHPQMDMTNVRCYNCN